MPRNADDFFGGPATFSFKDDQRMNKWFGGLITDDPFTQQMTVYNSQDPAWWDAEKTRPKMQLQVILDTSLGRMPERADANDDGVRRLFIKDSGDLNKAVQAALREVGVRKLERGGELYGINTGKRANDKGGNDARTFQALYRAPTAQTLALLDQRHPVRVEQPQAQVFDMGAAPQAPAPAAPPWEPSQAPAAPVFPNQPTTYAAPVQQQPQYAPAPVQLPAYAPPAPAAPQPAPEQANPFAPPTYAPPAYQPPAPEQGIAYQYPIGALTPAAPMAPGQVPPPAWATQPAAPAPEQGIPPNPFAS